jgi:tetratricopeptide (TPR) repeat protein
VEGLAIRGKGWLAMWTLALCLLSGCSSPPPPPPPAKLEALLELAVGKAAFHEMDIREALEHLHLAVHLDRELDEAQELFAMAAWTVGCGPSPMPCAFPAYGGRPDVWSGLGEDLSAHVAASIQEARRLEAAGQPDEAREFMRCAEDLAQLQAPLCPR